MKHIKLLFAVVAVMFSLISCKEEASVQDSLLDYVPSDAQTVATFNVNKFLTEAGCLASGDTITLSPRLNSLLENIGVNRETIMQADYLLSSGSLSTGQIVVYLAADSRCLFMFKVSDTTVFDCLFNGDDPLQWEYTDEYQCALFNGWRLVVENDTQNPVCWLLDEVTDSDAQYVAETVRRAQLASVADSEWRAQFLGSERILSALLREDFSDLYDGTEYADATVAVAFDSERDHATFDLKLLDSKGLRLPFNDLFAPIDLSFLQYLYPHDNIVLAMGIPANTDWDRLYDVASRLLNRRAQVTAALILPYLKDISGTVALAVGPASGAQSLLDASPETWDFIAMVPYKNGRAAEIYGELKTLAQLSGAEEVEGCLEYKVGEVTYLLKLEGDKLIVSNREILQRGDANIPVEIFDGKSVAMTGVAAYGSELMKALSLPFGVNVSAWSDRERAQVRIRLNRAPATFLESVITETASRIDEKN